MIKIVFLFRMLGNGVYCFSRIINRDQAYLAILQREDVEYVQAAYVEEMVDIAELHDFARRGFAYDDRRPEYVYPEAALSEMVRVLQPDGRIVIADIISSHVPEESELHNALEVLRDPSHVRMIPYTELKHLIRSAGLVIKTEDNWIREREFAEWMQITGAPERSRPLYVVMRELAGAGIRAGIELQIDGTTVVFKHRWILITADAYYEPTVKKDYSDKM